MILSSLSEGTCHCMVSSQSSSRARSEKHSSDDTSTAQAYGTLRFSPNRFERSTTTRSRSLPDRSSRLSLALSTIPTSDGCCGRASASGGSRIFPHGSSARLLLSRLGPAFVAAKPSLPAPRVRPYACRVQWSASSAHSIGHQRSTHSAAATCSRPTTI